MPPKYSKLNSRFTEDPPVKLLSFQSLIFRIVFVLTAIAILLNSQILTQLRNPDSLYTLPYWVGCISSVGFCLGTLWLVVWKYILHRGQSHTLWKVDSRRHVLITTISGIVAYWTLSFAFWPVYGVRTFFIFGILSYACLCILSFI